jgi:hypothetical protein
VQRFSAEAAGWEQGFAFQTAVVAGTDEPIDRLSRAAPASVPIPSPALHLQLARRESQAAQFAEGGRQT